MIIHNAEFDLSHINNELSLLGEKNLTNEIVDTLVLARNKYPGSPGSLTLCKRYRIDNSRRTKHTALIDCDLLAKVYINLIDQKEPTLNLQSSDREFSNKISSNDEYCKKIIKPNREELSNIIIT